MDKVIFLDIDGVLNSEFWNDSHQKEISDGSLNDEENVVLLGKLVRETEASIILHSGWRFWFDEKLHPLRKEAEHLRNLLEKEGVYIVGRTPDYTTEEIRRTKKFSLVKAAEILGWLADHQEVERWVVIDDLDLHNAEIAMHQIKTDPSIGLTMEDVEEAVMLLLC